MTLREIVMGWDENQTPTIEQLQAALHWWRLSNGSPNSNGKCERLLERFRPDPPLKIRR